MIHATVRAGVCGFVTRITAESEDEQHVTLRIDTDCDKIRKLADALPSLDAYAEIQAGHDGEVMKAVRANLKGCCGSRRHPRTVIQKRDQAISTHAHAVQGGSHRPSPRTRFRMHQKEPWLSIEVQGS